MYEIEYTKIFVKKYKKIRDKNPDLALEIKEKIEEFKNKKNHQKLKVHKLKKPFSGIYSFSVNYKIRILFQYKKEKIIVLLTVGDHDIYK